MAQQSPIHITTATATIINPDNFSKHVGQGQQLDLRSLAVDGSGGIAKDLVNALRHGGYRG